MYDRNAISVWDSQGRQVGYMPREEAVELAGRIDLGWRFVVTVTELTGDGSFNHGVLIRVAEVSNHDRSYVDGSSEIARGEAKKGNPVVFNLRGSNDDGYDGEGYEDCDDGGGPDWDHGDWGYEN